MESLRRETTDFLIGMAVGLMFTVAFFVPKPGHTQTADDAVKIGVLNDQSGVYADFGGPGSVVAARMAAQDMGGNVLGKPVVILSADHQNKADSAIGRRWFDVDRVSMIADFSNSSVALAIEALAYQRDRVAIAGAVGTIDYTGKACTPTEASWLHDTYPLTVSLVRAALAKGSRYVVHHYGRLRLRIFA